MLQASTDYEPSVLSGVVGYGGRLSIELLGQIGPGIESSENPSLVTVRSGAPSIYLVLKWFAATVEIPLAKKAQIEVFSIEHLLLVVEGFMARVRHGKV